MKGPNNSHMQVFYLDNVEIGDWDMDHSVLPRISSFTYERIRGMIAADTLLRNDAKSTPGFGKSKVKKISLLHLLVRSLLSEYMRKK